jgi:hypothetical protein
MAIKLAERKRLPRRITIYGPPGVGKTTFACSAPNAIVIPSEDGANDIDVDQFPLCRTLADWIDCVNDLATNDHEYNTAVIDSADWLEMLCNEQVCQSNGIASVGDLGFGKGFAQAAALFAQAVKSLDALRQRGMQVVVTAHSSIVSFNDPNGEAYDRYQPKLDKRNVGPLIEWSDELLFAHHETLTNKTDSGKTKGISTGRRVVEVTEAATHLAKNRLGLTESIELSWPAYSQLAYPPKKEN